MKAWLKLQLAAGWQHFCRQSKRDQIAMLAGLVAVLIYAAYWLAYWPLTQALQQSTLRNQVLAQQLIEVQALTQQLQQANEQQPRQQSVSLADVVDRSLRAHQLALRSYQPGANQDAQIRLENVAFDRLLAWLYDLEINQQIRLRELTLAAASTEGHVAVNLRVQQVR